jgi:Cdc6-like AAA superfamily ATPase
VLDRAEDEDPDVDIPFIKTFFPNFERRFRPWIHKYDKQFEKNVLGSTTTAPLFKDKDDLVAFDFKGFCQAWSLLLEYPIYVLSVEYQSVATHRQYSLEKGKEKEIWRGYLADLNPTSTLERWAFKKSIAMLRFHILWKRREEHDTCHHCPLASVNSRFSTDIPTAEHQIGTGPQTDSQQAGRDLPPVNASISACAQRLDPESSQAQVQPSVQESDPSLALKLADVEALVVSQRFRAIKDDTTFIRDSVNEIQQNRKREHHCRIVEWISSADFAAEQSNIIAQRQEGTCQWLLNSPEYTSCLHGSKQTLFCTGIPGAGKTMLSAIVVDHLSRTMECEAVGLTYMFCHYKQADQSAVSLLATMLKQLVQARPSIAEPVSFLYEHHSCQGTRPSLEEIFGALQSVVNNYTKVYVVVDALDECSEWDGTRGQLLSKLSDLQEQADLRLMATSRFVPDTTEKLRDVSRLEIRASDADARRFVSGYICRLPKCIQRDTTLQNMVQELTVEAADGM